MLENKLINKFLSFSIGSWLTLLIGFVTTPLLTRLIPPDVYGQFSMFNLITSVVMVIFIFGLDQSFVRFFYEKAEYDRPRLLYICLAPPLVVSGVASSFVLLFWRGISRILFNEESFFSILLIVICAIVMYLNRYSLLVVRMQQKGKMYSLLTVIQKLTYIIFVLCMLKFKVIGFYALITATTISFIVTLIIGIAIEKGIWFPKSKRGKVTYREFRQVFQYGSPLVITFLVTWLFQSSDRIAIKIWGGYSDLGIYTSAFTIVSLLNVVQTSFTTFWTPIAFEKFEEHRNERKFFENMTLLVSFVMFLIGVVIIIAKDIFVLLLGDSYREAAFIMPFLVFMPIMHTISETTVIGINFRKKSHYHFIISILTCLLNIVGNAVLVPWIGAKGAAISTGVSYVVFLYLRTILSKRLYNMDYSMRRITISTLMIILLAVYSTFNSFNLIYLLLGLLNLAVIVGLYFKRLKILYDTSRDKDF
jgi:O-antigen/teichoic acid export membrane protein